MVYGGYRAYIEWWDTGAVRYLKASVQDVVGDSGRDARNKVLDETGEYAQAVVGEAGGTVRDYAASTAAQALAYVGEKITSVASSIGGSAPISPIQVFSGGGTADSISVPASENVSFSVPPPFATVATRVGSPLVLSINRPSSYSIDWGDGSSASGTVRENEVRLVRHAWSRQGDFHIRVTLEGSGGVNSSFFPVRAYDE